MKKYIFWIILFNLLSLTCPAYTYAYLDPGTGSMLLSAIVGLSATVFFMAKAIWYRLLNLFFRITGTSAPDTGGHGIVFYSEGAQYWNVFKPVLEAIDKSAAEIIKNNSVLYLSSGKKDPGLEHHFEKVEARYIGEGNRAFTLLNMLEADILVMTTPGLDVLQIRRSPGVKHFVHIVHAVTDISTYKLFSFDYFDTFMCSGPYQEKSLRYLEELRGTPKKNTLETGCPYMDVLDLAFKKDSSEKKRAASKEARPPETLTAKALTAEARPPEALAAETLAAETLTAKTLTVKARQPETLTAEELTAEEKSAKNILIAPTWGRNGLLSRFGSGLVIPLAEAAHKIIIRPHPQSFISELELMEKIKKELSAYPNIEWDRAPSAQESMLKSDLMISDLSGIVFDYAFGLERPVITVEFEADFRGYEGNDLPWDPWEISILPELGIQLKAEDIHRLPDLLKGVLSSSNFADNIRKIRDENVYNYGKCGPVAAQQLVELLTAQQETDFLNEQKSNDLK